MKQLITLLLFFSLISCSNRSVGNATENETDKFKLDPDFDYAHLIPDSLRTPEQQKIVKTLFTAIEKYTTIDTCNNKLVFNATVKDFTDMGLAKQYYDLWQQNVKDVNKNNNPNDNPVVIDIKSYWQETLKMIDAIKNNKPIQEGGYLKTIDERK